MHCLFFVFVFVFLGGEYFNGNFRGKKFFHENIAILLETGKTTALKWRTCTCNFHQNNCEKHGFTVNMCTEMNLRWVPS